MSEFSDSYHLMGSTQDAVDLLTRGTPCLTKSRAAILR